MARAKASPYDPLLDQLAAATPGQALRFADTRARAALYARAKKKGLKVSFAESNGSLYVRLDGRVDDDVHKTRRDQIVAALKRGPLGHIQIAAKLREGGDSTVDAQLVETILGQLLRDGVVVKRESGDWTLSAKAARSAA